MHSESSSHCAGSCSFVLPYSCRVLHARGRALEYIDGICDHSSRPRLDVTKNTCLMSLRISIGSTSPAASPSRSDSSSASSSLRPSSKECVVYWTKAKPQLGSAAANGIVITVAGAGGGPGPEGCMGPCGLYSQLASSLPDLMGMDVVSLVYSGRGVESGVEELSTCVEYMKRARLGPLFLMGWSMGGAVVIEVAARYQHELLSSPSSPCYPANTVTTLSSSSSPGSSSFPSPAKSTMSSSACSSPVHNMIGGVITLASQTAQTSRVTELISLPKLFVHGLDDRCLSYQCSLMLAKRSPTNATVRLLEAASHGVEGAEQCIYDWLREHVITPHAYTLEAEKMKNS